MPDARRDTSASLSSVRPRPSDGAVVVGTDGSPASRAALRWGAAMSRRHGHPLVLLTAQSGAGADDAGARILEQHVAALLRGQAREWGEVDDVHAEVAWTAPGAGLVAASRGAACVVVGSRGSGRGDTAGTHCGSVAATVAEHAAAPVVVVPPDWSEEDGPIVVGVDGSPESAHAALFAGAHAQSLGRDVLAVHAVDHPDLLGAVLGGPRSPGTAPPVHDRVLDEALSDLAQDHPAVRVRQAVLHGRPGAVLAAASPSPALVVVGSRGTGGFPGLLLGSVPRALLAAPPAPVAVVRG